MKNEYRCLRCGSTWRSRARWWCNTCGMRGSDVVMEPKRIGVLKGDVRIWSDLAEMFNLSVETME